VTYFTNFRFYGLPHREFCFFHLLIKIQISCKADHAPPNPENTKMGIRENVIACSSVFARMPKNNLGAETHSPALNATGSRQAGGQVLSGDNEKTVGRLLPYFRGTFGHLYTFREALIISA
jgi:hypothetical protein